MRTKIIGVGEMNLVEFLTVIQDSMSEMTYAEVKALVYNIAKKVPAEQREAFLKSYLKPKDGETIKESSKDKFQVIKGGLDKIVSQDVYLESEINEDFDDWYNDMEPEYKFFDYFGLLQDIHEAVFFIEESIADGNYEQGLIIAEILNNLEILIEGEYYDDDFRLEDLYYYELLDYEFPLLLANCLYLILRQVPLEQRPKTVFHFFNRYSRYGLTLELALQAGADLPDLADFLPLWLDFLGKRAEPFVENLVSEAFALQMDKIDGFAVAKKYTQDHPELIEAYLAKVSLTLSPEELYQKEKEALDLLPVDTIIRSRIALKLAELAKEFGERQDVFWLEAFKSHSTVTNLLRLLQGKPDLEALKAHISQVEVVNNVYYQTIKYKNFLSKSSLALLQILIGDGHDIFKREMDTSKSLGWSDTFIKTGLAIYSLILLEGENLSLACQNLLNHLVGVTNFSATAFYQKESNQDSAELLWELLKNWKGENELQESSSYYLDIMEIMMRNRVAAIMKDNRRNYYEECAIFIAAIGEVRESLGQVGAKQELMMSYRKQYYRKRNFTKALRVYGLKD